MKTLKCQMKVKGKKFALGGTRPETFEKRPLSKSALICPISASGSNFIPLFGGTRNIQYIPVVEIFAFLDLDQN